MDALVEFGWWQAAAQGQAQAGNLRRQGVEHRRGDRQMPETVAGDVDEKMQISGA